MSPPVCVCRRDDNLCGAIYGRWVGKTLTIKDPKFETIGKAKFANVKNKAAHCRRVDSGKQGQKAEKRGSLEAKTGALGLVHFRGDVNRWNST
jgi:hypothetical protein